MPEFKHEEVDLTDVEIQQCPYDAYKKLREDAPVYQDPKTNGSKTIKRSKNESNGIEFTYVTWIYVNDWAYKYGDWKHIFCEFHKYVLRYSQNKIQRISTIFFDVFENYSSGRFSRYFQKVLSIFPVREKCCAGDITNVSQNIWEVLSG